MARTSAWALNSIFDDRIKKERELLERKHMQEAKDLLDELRAYELIDDGLAYEIEPLYHPGH